MFTIKQALKISAIVDKTGVKITNPEGTPEEVGADLMLQIATKAYKAEKEIYNLVASINKISEKEAEEVDIMEFAKGLFGDSDFLNFFKSAVKQKMNE